MSHRRRYKTLIVLCIILLVIAFAMVLTPEPLPAPVVVQPATDSTETGAQAIEPVTDNTAPEESVRTENELVIAINKGGSINGMVIVPTKIVEDSRCPMNARCIQAGTVKVAASVTGGAKTGSYVFELGADAIVINEKQIRLISVTPEVELAGVNIPSTDYSFVFSIE
jgi:hypothetical protein